MKYRNVFLVLLLVAGAWLWRRWYQTPAYGGGEQAPDFTGYLPNGDSVRLSHFRGKTVLLDFWGSWCGPCRRANRDLVALYAEFAPAGKLEILSVGIEDKAEKWQRAIAQDGLNWPYHISDLRMFDDHVARLYGVRSIPTTLLIDTAGRIVAVSPDAEQLRSLLREQ